MKNLVLLAVLAAVAVCNAAVVDPVQVEQSVAIFGPEAADELAALVVPRALGEPVAVEPKALDESGAVFEFAGEDDEVIGDVSSRNRLIFSNSYRRNPITNAVQVQTVRITFAANIRITGVRVARVGANQNAMAHIIDGGVNRNFVVIRFTSARGRGFNYSVQIHGR